MIEGLAFSLGVKERQRLQILGGGRVFEMYEFQAYI